MTFAKLKVGDSLVLSSTPKTIKQIVKFLDDKYGRAFEVVLKEISWEYKYRPTQSQLDRHYGARSNWPGLAKEIWTATKTAKVPCIEIGKNIIPLKKFRIRDIRNILEDVENALKETKN